MVHSHPMRVTLTKGISLASLILALAMVAACDSPTSPSGPLEGTWTGPIQSSLSGVGSARVTLSQSGSDVMGTWGATFPANPAANDGGAAAGSVSGSSVTIVLSPTNPGLCPYRATQR